MGSPYVRCPAMFAKLSMCSCAHMAHTRNIPINPSKLNSKKMHNFTANTFYNQTCEYAFSIARMSHHEFLNFTYHNLTRSKFVKQ